MSANLESLLGAERQAQCEANDSAELYAQHSTQWKCVSCRAGQSATCQTFNTEHEAREFAERTGHTLIRPRNYPTDGTGGVIRIPA